jgi:hypothetical protein
MGSRPIDPSQVARRIGGTGRRPCAGTRVCRMLRSLAVVVAISLLVSACGGGGSPSAAAGPSTGASSVASRVLAFASCVRTHGVTSYPDPQVTSSGNHVSVKISPGAADPNSSAFKTANQACHHLLPNGGLPAYASSGQLAQDVTFADCIRAHGDAFLTPITTACSPFPPESTLKRPRCCALSTLARASSQARSASIKAGHADPRLLTSSLSARRFRFAQSSRRGRALAGDCILSE